MLSRVGVAGAPGFVVVLPDLPKGEKILLPNRETKFTHGISKDPGKLGFHILQGINSEAI